MQTLEQTLDTKRAIQLKLLNEISTRLQSLLDSENFNQEIVDLIQNHLHLYCVQIWSANADGTATLQAQSGAYGSHLHIGHTLGVSTGIIGRVIRTRKTYLSNDTATDPNFTNLSLPIESKSEISVPVIKDGELMAILNVESNEGNAFDEMDVITLEAIASQVAVAITNRNLFTQVKDFNERLQQAVENKTEELKQANERILQQQKLLQKENKTLKNLVSKDHKAPSIIGESPALRSTLDMVEKIAPTAATVLLQGESGTGKELIARMLHFKSDRTHQPYVTVNCGALQESLLESELFGHEKGSFTGAVAQKIGLAEVADSGTLFLDEIGEMSLAIQTKLLRFLQEGEFYRIGGKRPIKVNVRVISATNRDLEQEVKEGRFREDLFYRINTITLRVPPLRKRIEDVPVLVEHFLKHSRFGGAPGPLQIDPQVMKVLMNYPWPGNIRELQNTIERMKILAESQILTLDDIPSNIRAAAGTSLGIDGPDYAVELPLEEVEKKHILRALTHYEGNKTQAARSLGITIKTLYNKLHRYGMFAENQLTDRM